VREYETTVIVQPEISDEGSQAILGKLDTVLEERGATRLMCSDLGKRKLAYEIRKFQKGHYYVLSYLDDGKAVNEIERNLRIEESVLRFLTVRVEDEVLDIAARQEEARIAEIEQQKRAAEKAAREAEEAAARAEVERQAAEEARAGDDDDDDSDDSDDYRVDDDDDDEEDR
jgi:small subunit ribosomal protein S6